MDDAEGRPMMREVAARYESLARRAEEQSFEPDKVQATACGEAGTACHARAETDAFLASEPTLDRPRVVLLFASA
jgi:hypothetical protein